MAKMNDSNSTAYTNPTSVPKKVEIISPTDPRNNILYLAQNPNVIVKEDETGSESEDPSTYESLEDFSSEQSDPTGNTNPNYFVSIPNQVNLVVSIVPAPSNLYLDPKSFRLESASSTNTDGGITMVGTLTFDEVPGAVSYEYEINSGV